MLLLGAVLLVGKSVDIPSVTSTLHVDEHIGSASDSASEHDRATVKSYWVSEVSWTHMSTAYVPRELLPMCSAML